MKRIVTTLLLIIGFTTLSFAQQEPNYTMFWNNYSSFNPAYSGLENDFFSSLTYRNQWKGLIKTVNFNVDGKIEKINSGIGLNYTRDVVGVATTNKLNTNYNYQINLFDSLILSTALAIGLDRKSFNFSNPLAPNGNACNDPAINCSKEVETKLNVNGGFALKGKNFTVGIGVMQFTKQQFDALSYSANRHLFISGLYTYNVSSTIKIIPSFLQIANLDDLLSEINTRVIFNDLAWVGVTYRHQVSVSGMLGATIAKKIDIGYSYDYSTNRFSTSGLAHEIAVSFRLKNQSKSGSIN